MEGHRLEIGRTYAFREKRSTSSPLLKVKLLDKIGRWLRNGRARDSMGSAVA
jgi:hypothetical protein